MGRRSTRALSLLLALASPFAAGAAGSPATDPVIVRSTLIGGSGADELLLARIDAAGDLHVAGTTSSRDFPVKNASQPAFGGGSTDVVVAKIDPRGGLLLRATYLGGSGDEQPWDLAVDGAGSSYVVGDTTSEDFPLADPFLATPSRGFLAQIDAAGALDHATYVGAASVRAVVVDGASCAWIGGAAGAGFPTAGAFQPGYGGGGDGFVARFDASGRTLWFSSYIGGSAADLVTALALDPSGELLVAGETRSADFPVVAALQPAISGLQDGFVAKLATGPTVAPSFATYLGGRGVEFVVAVGSDAGGDVFVGGSTSSPDYPVVAAFQPVLQGAADIVLATLSPSGARILHATYLGGPDAEWAGGFAVDGQGQAALAAGSTVPWEPLLEGTLVAQATAGGAGILHATMLPGRPSGRTGIAIGPGGEIHVAGSTREPGFPVVFPFPAGAGGSGDAFVLELARACSGLALSPAPLPDGVAGAPYAARITASGGTPPYHLAVSSGALPPGVALSPAGVLSGVAGLAGSYGFELAAVDAAGSCGTRAAAIHVRGAGPREEILAGKGAGPGNESRVRALTPDGATSPLDLLAYAAGGFGVDVAGLDDPGAIDALLTGPGPGPLLGPHVRAFDAQGSPVAAVSYYAYGTLAFGVEVEGAELDGDARDEIVTGAGAGALFGPHVRGWRRTGAKVVPLPGLSFHAYQTLRHGVAAAACDGDGDGRREIVSGPGPGPTFQPHVRSWWYDGAPPVRPGASFFAYPATRYGVAVAGGAFDGSAREQFATARGPGPGAGYHPELFVREAGGAPRAWGFVLLMPSAGGRVALGDLTGDGSAELLVGLGPDPSSDARVRSLRRGLQHLLEPLLVLEPFPGGASGVNVATSDLGSW